MIFDTLPLQWKEFLELDYSLDIIVSLSSFIENEYTQKEIFPPKNQLFTAFNLTPPDAVKVVIIGQDPYPTRGHAHGLAFSYLGDTGLPRSLQNIFKELKTDLNTSFSITSGDLTPWATQGVLLLNTVLTVQAALANSHKGKGWEFFTALVIKKLLIQNHPIIFVLWGNESQKIVQDPPQHHIIFKTAHPSPLSAQRGFFNSKIFTRINTALQQYGYPPIDWLKNRKEDQLL